MVKSRAREQDSLVAIRGMRVTMANTWKWCLLLAFFAFDFFQVLLISMTRLETSVSHWGVPFTIRIEGALESAVLIIAMTFLVRIVYLVYSVRKLFGASQMQLIYDRGEKKEIDSTILSGEITTADIVKITLEIAAKFKVRVDKIYISRTPLPNAYTIDTVPLPFIRRSYIVVNSNIIDVLSIEEIKAVIAHEIGHISASDSTLKLIFTGAGMYLHLAYLYLYIRIIISAAQAFFENFEIILALQRLSFLAFTYVFVWIVSNISMFLLYRANRQSELLADIHGAEMVGKETMINMLVKLGQRFSCIDTIYNEVTWLEKLENPEIEKPDRKFLLSIINKFPAKELDERKAMEMAPELYIRNKLANFEKYYNFKIEADVEESIKRAAKELFEKRMTFLEKVEERKVVDWRDSDINRNFNLEKEEIDHFVKELKDNPERFLFETEILKDKKNVFMNHPNFRERILNIYDF
ncbi:MAG: M48 family metallopeptidase [Candidatus Hodarchaeales archaeon]